MTDRSSLRQSWPLWCAGFLAFPVAGLAGSGVVGRVDGATGALLGGLVAGLVLGGAQSLVSRGSSSSSVPTGRSSSRHCPGCSCTSSSPTADEGWWR